MTTPETPPPPVKKGLHPLAWVAIGCGVLIVIGVIGLAVGIRFVGQKASQFVQEAEDNPALAAARIIAATNPEIELVEEESDRDTIVFRNVETGETVRVEAEDVEEGRISFETGEGSVSIDASGGEDGGTMTVTTEEGTAVYRGGAGAAGDVPSWVLRYPGAEMAGAYSARTGEGLAGAFTLTTGDSPREVLDYYERELQAAGYETQVQTFTQGDEGFAGMVHGALADPPRTLNVTAGSQEGETQATVQYSSEEG